MKYIITSIVLAVTLFGFELGWSDDYDAALVKAKQEHKPVYILITSETCGWCRKFEKTTLQKPEVKQRLQKEFITVHLSRDLNFVPKVFQTSPVPRHYFVDENGKILYNSLGYRKKDVFNSFMDNAKEKLQKNK